MTDTALARLADRMGLERRYHQVDGTEHVAGPETQMALLTAMGLEVASERDAADHHAALEARAAARALPPHLLVRAEAVAEHAALADLPPWRIALEAGGTLEADRARPAHLPPLPVGVHVLRAGEPGEAETLVIASPARAPSVQDLTGRPQGWGVTVALYGLRSARNLGVGDYEDLARLAGILGAGGADLVGINPVHALGAAETGISPYSPSSRSGFDTGHIAIDRLPELADCPVARDELARAGLALEVARDASLVDRRVRRHLAEPCLRALFAAFETAPGPERDARRAAFAAWEGARDPACRLQSVYEALSLRFGPDWRDWPQGFRDGADHPDLRAWMQAQSREIRYHEWLQWVAETQIAAAQAQGRRAGMGLGLYLDIAVGVRPGGAETWAWRDEAVFARGCSLGAPPDLLNSEGQDWNLAPFSPIGLAETGYAAFRAMLRTAMGVAGAVRIDHVIGFQRSFWVPENGAPGGYVRFPMEVLLALTRIEAHRHRCLVIGEDLGTVPEGLRAALAGSGLLGCAILPFERAGDGFAAPADYREKSLAAFGTHDLPTLRGWWQGRDIEIRTDLGHLRGEPVQWAWDERAWARTRLCHLLAEAGLLPEGIDPDRPPPALTEALRDGVHALLAAGASETVAAQLDDIFRGTEQQNVPGTVEEQPNWRRKAPVALEDLETAPEWQATAALMRARRGP